MFRRIIVIFLIVLLMIPLSSCASKQQETETQIVETLEPVAEVTVTPVPTPKITVQPTANVTVQPSPIDSTPEPNQYVLYLKDIELYYSDLVHEPSQITRYMLANQNRETPGFIRSIYDDFCKYNLHVSQGGASIFFPDQIGQQVPQLVFRPGEGMPLFLSEDTLINRYSEDGRVFVHQREDYSLERIVTETDGEKKTVDTDLDMLYTLSLDGRTAVYKKKDGSLWIQTDWDAPRMLSARIDRALAYDDERSVLIYREGNTVYEVNGKGESVVVTTTDFECLMLYPDGSMFFCDPSSSRAVQIVDKVFASPEKLEKEEPDSTGIQTVNARTLYFFDGQETHMLTDSFVGGSDSYCFAKNRPVMAFLVSTGGESHSVMKPYRDGYRDALQRTVADGKNVYGIQEHWGRVPDLSADGGCLLFMEDCQGVNPGLLYRVKIGENGPEEPEILMEDVSVTIRPQFMGESSSILSCRDVMQETVSLYLDGELVAKEVSIGACEYDDETGSLAYFKDMVTNAHIGTLYLYKDGKNRKVDEMVNTVEFAAEGRILYLKNDGKGLFDLMMDRDGAKTVLDQGVSLIFCKKDVLQN